MSRDPEDQIAEAARLLLGAFRQIVRDELERAAPQRGSKEPAPSREPVRRWLSVGEAHEYSGRSPGAISNALRDGSLRGNQRVRGGTWLIYVEDLDRWLRGEKADPRPESERAPRITRGRI